MLLFGDFGDLEARILFTTIAIGVFSILGLGCAALYDTKRFEPVAVAGMVAAVTNFACALLFVWEMIEFTEFPIRLFFALLVLTITLTHACLLLRIKPKTALTQNLRWATLIAISLVAIMLWVVIVDVIDLSDFYWRLFGVITILDVLGSLVTPVVNLIKA